MSRSPYIAFREEQEEHPWRTALLVLALLAVILIIAYGLISVRPVGMTAERGVRTDAISAVENPELSLYLRYSDAAQARAKAAFLANNPELLIVQQYAGWPEVERERAFLAKNPELMAATRYEPVTIAGSADRFLARNPEVILFRRFTGE